jgi:hypothetical protein
MAYIKRALRRRLLWTLLAATLAAAVLTGCLGQDPPPASEPPPPSQAQDPPPASAPSPQPTGSQPEEATILQELGQISTTWLNGFAAPSATDLGCPQTEFEVAVTGAGAGDLEPCLFYAGNQWSLRVRNRTGVPITVSGPDISLWTVQPNSTVYIRLAGNPVFAKFTFKPNVAAGVSMALLDKLNTRPVPKGLEWVQCAVQSDMGCLAKQAADLLGEVKIGNTTIPVGRVASLLIELWQQRSLIKAFVGHEVGQEGGSLVVRER